MKLEREARKRDGIPNSPDDMVGPMHGGERSPSQRSYRDTEEGDGGAVSGSGETRHEKSCSNIVPDTAHERLEDDTVLSLCTGKVGDALSACRLEDDNVRDVYDAIAPHFGATRFAVWPKVKAFIDNLPHGALVADVGCGNGKYFAIRRDIFVSGSDRSRGEKLSSLACFYDGIYHNRLCDLFSSLVKAYRCATLAIGFMLDCAKMI